MYRNVQNKQNDLAAVCAIVRRMIWKAYSIPMMMVMLMMVAVVVIQCELQSYVLV